MVFAVSEDTDDGIDQADNVLNLPASAFAHYTLPNDQHKNLATYSTSCQDSCQPTVLKMCYRPELAMRVTSPLGHHWCVNSRPDGSLDPLRWSLADDYPIVQASPKASHWIVSPAQC